MNYAALPRRLSFFWALLLALPSVWLLAGCDPLGPRPERGDNTELRVGKAADDGQQLLSVQIAIFDFQPLPDERRERLGLNTALREAEQRFIASHLKHSLRNSGHWRRVEVVPLGESLPADLRVQGKILQSDGETLRIHLLAQDALGDVWLDKDFEAVARPADYRHTRIAEQDAFQSLYNRVANALLSHRQQLTDRQLHAIQSARLAALVESLGGSADSAAVTAIDQRLTRLANTYDQTYDAFYRAIWDDYRDWRKQRLNVYENIRESAQQGAGTTALGVGAIAAGILAYAYGDQHNSTSGSVATAASIPIILGGAYATSKGIDAQGDTLVYVDQLDAQSKTLSDSTDPLLYSLIERIRQLKKRAHAAMENWRQQLG